VNVVVWWCVKAVRGGVREPVGAEAYPVSDWRAPPICGVSEWRDQRGMGGPWRLPGQRTGRSYVHIRGVITGATPPAPTRTDASGETRACVGAHPSPSRGSPQHAALPPPRQVLGGQASPAGKQHAEGGEYDRQNSRPNDGPHTTKTAVVAPERRPNVVPARGAEVVRCFTAPRTPAENAVFA